MPDDEVGRVARAFNAMTESLRRTLHELSQRRALAAVGEFAASLAHEVRNPLTSIRVDLQRAEEKLAPDSDARGLLTRALGSIERVDRSVTGALQMARSGSIERKMLDLRKPLEAAIHAAKPEFAARRATLESVRLGDSAVEIEGDAPALERLFLNLLLNAAQALGDAGHASVTVKRRGDTVSIVIQDSGGGIGREDLEKVFEPFYSTRSEGTGLGLAIARQIVVAHGGEITIDSTPGTGTRVEVVLPRRPDAST
jgi:signal transduction histidine kinase